MASTILPEVLYADNADSEVKHNDNNDTTLLY